ncbi:MAG: hypothetical protein ACRDRH_09075 [Pseudonocardia sp.]
MTDSELFSRQHARWEDAHQIVTELDLLDRWRSLGVPAVCGSVAHGLVVAPDIDVEIIGGADVRRGFALVADWAATPAGRKVLFLDDLDGPGGRARLTADLSPTWTGLGRPDVVAAARLCRSPSHRPDRSTPPRVLNPDRRAAILRIKEELLRQQRPFSSIDIYRAVIENGVANAAGFDDWPGPTPTGGVLTDWLPNEVLS